MRTHDLKVWPCYFDSILAGTKRFELRKNDRGYQLWDRLTLREWSVTTSYTGRNVDVTVVYMLMGVPGLRDDYCILGIERADS